MTVILRILTFLEMAMFSCTAIVVFLPSNINDEKKEKKKRGGRGEYPPRFTSAA